MRLILSSCVAILLSFHCTVALADVVSPAPTNCPEGSTGRMSHAGPYCRANDCDTDATACGTDKTCQSRTLCILQRSGVNMAGSFTVKDVTGSCAADGACTTGTCATLSVCTSASGSGGSGGGAASTSGGGQAGAVTWPVDVGGSAQGSTSPTSYGTASASTGATTGKSTSTGTSKPGGAGTQSGTGTSTTENSGCSFRAAGPRSLGSAGIATVAGLFAWAAGRRRRGSAV